MSEDTIENLKSMNFFLSDIPDLFSPINIDNEENEFKNESKEEPPIKQPIKFILTKQVTPSVSFLQKKTCLKLNDSSTDIENSNNGRWRKDEQQRFAEAVLNYGNDWKNIQNHVSSRNITQVRSHAQKFLMKLKESNFLINKGLDQNQSWTKIMNFLKNNLSYDELKDVLFSVEQTGQKKIGGKKHKILKKIKKVDNNQNGSAEQLLDDNNTKINHATNEDNCRMHLYYGKNFLNLDEEEENYNIKFKMIKKEEEEKELQIFIECFNSTSGEITLNSSFEENSYNKVDEEEIGYNYLNKKNIKYNKYF